MSGLIKIPMSEDSHVIFEVSDDDITSDTETLAGDTQGAVLTERFDGILANIKPAISAIFSSMNELAKVPDEFEIETGIKFNADVGAIFAKFSSEANLKVRMVWKKQDKK